MRFRKTLILAAAATVLSSYTACNNSTDNPITTGTQYAPPDSVRALSGNGSVWLKWKPSKQRDSLDFSDYVISATPVGGGTTMTMNATKAADSMEFTGLMTGMVYSFSIKSEGRDGTLGASSNTVQWAPAKFYNGIFLYSLQAPASTGKFSGLRLGPNGVRAASVSLEPDSVDVVFDDRGVTYDLLSANLKSGTVMLPRQTDFASFDAYGTSLTDLSVADMTVDTAGWAPKQWHLGTDNLGGTSGKGQMIFVRTQDNYYARIFVHANGSKLYSSDGTYKYLTLDVSMQPVQGNIFSGVRRILGAKSIQ